MTGDRTEETPVPAPGGDGPPAPKRRRRRRKRGKRPQASAAQGRAVPAQEATQPASAGDPHAKRAAGPKDGAATSAQKGGGRRRRRPPPKNAKGGTKKGARQPQLTWTKEVSAGGVVYRRAEDGAIEVVLASRRTRRGDLAWGLAKGGIEDGESREAAAIREVREETGLTAEIEADLGDTKYMYVWEDVRIRKTVHFFLMRFTGGDVDDRDDEMEEIRWFPMERALKRAAYRGERDMLKRAAELLT
jgi:8-oxo-dGTP pyrophosphatase MutT (NUDIX family)